MTTIKLLSAGLVAAVMFTIPADAHESSVTEPDVVTKGNASAPSPAVGFAAVLAFQHRVSANLLRRPTMSPAALATSATMR